MRVGFERTGERRYAVRAQRDLFDDVVMHPAPGFDAWLPHDLVHFVVERECELRDGVFGTLAAGGNAFTFRPADGTHSRAWARRAARANAGHGGQLSLSEAIASAADQAWHASAGGSSVDIARLPGVDGPAAAVQGPLAAVAHRWHALPVGGSLALDWPWPERRR